MLRRIAICGVGLRLVTHLLIRLLLLLVADVVLPFLKSIHVYGGKIALAPHLLLDLCLFNTLRDALIFIDSVFEIGDINIIHFIRFIGLFTVFGRLEKGSTTHLQWVFLAAVFLVRLGRAHLDVRHTLVEAFVSLIFVLLLIFTRALFLKFRAINIHFIVVLVFLQNCIIRFIFTNDFTRGRTAQRTIEILDGDRLVLVVRVQIAVEQFPIRILNRLRPFLLGQCPLVLA